MYDKKPKILIAFKVNGQNGGPYISHKRIMENEYLNHKYDFDVLWIPKSRAFLNPFFFFGFVKKLKKTNPNIVHIAGLQLDGFLLMLACRFARVKTVLAVHGSTAEALNIGTFRKSISKPLEKYTIKKATYVYGVSDYVSDWKICSYSKNFFGTIYNIPDDLVKTDDTSTIREELKIPSEDVVIVSTGRIVKDKGFDTLCNIIKRYKGRDKVRFVIAGDGEYKEQFEHEIKNEGMQGKVFFLGYRSDIQNILKGSDIFIICTKHETLCISALEAAKESLPLVVSNVGGLPEIVDNLCGYLVDPYDEDGFVNALDELIGSREKRKTMGNNALNKVNSKFSSYVTEKKLDDLYKSVLGK